MTDAEWAEHMKKEDKIIRGKGDRKMKIILQRTHRAHTTWPTYGDDPIEISRHNSLRTAVMALQRHTRAMHKACDQGSWSHNYRLVCAKEIWGCETEISQEDIWQEMSNQEQ